MFWILDKDQMADTDRRTIETFGIPQAVLMERAALFAKTVLDSHMGSGRTAIVCGNGNNGGDGLALARLLAEEGREVVVLLPSPEGRKSEGFLGELSCLQSYGVEPKPFAGELLENGGFSAVVDAVFGNGLTRELGSPYAEAVAAVNAWREGGKERFVLALDLPSGIASDGRVMGTAVRADATAVFGFHKAGNVLDPGRQYCGSIFQDHCGITEKSLNIAPFAFTYDSETVSDLLPERRTSGNKGSFGKVSVFAGSVGMAGAALLAGRSCYRSGAGMVRIVTPAQNRVIVQTSLPEALLTVYEAGEEESIRRAVRDACRFADTLAAGPGLGKSAGASRLLHVLFHEVLSQEQGRCRGLVLDADAINLIAEEEDLRSLLPALGEKTELVFTPHKVEACRLLRTTLEELGKNPGEMLRAFAKENRCTIYCKDARSICAGYGHESLYINTSGSAALAKAGSGDVLAGMTAAFLGRGMKGFEAACAAGYFHGRAAERLAALRGIDCVMAMDLADALL